MKPDSIIRERLFIRFLAGQLSSQLAVQMLLVGLGWQVYLITESAMALGWVGLARYLPQLLFSLHSGSVADHHNRIKVIIWTRALLFITMLMLSFTSYNDSINEYIIYFACILFGISQTYSMPAGQAIIPSLIDREKLSQALTLTASGRESITIIGPALGGVIYIFGADALYAICGAIVALSAFTLSGLIDTQPEERKGSTDKKELFKGFSFVWGNKPIFGSMLLDTLAILIGSVTALLPMIAHDILQTDSVGLGLLRSAPAAGAVAISIVLAHYPIKRNAGKKLYAAVMVFGLATIGFGLSDNLTLSLSMLFILGVADMVSVVIRSTLVHIETPDHMRGRVSAVNSLAISTSNQLGEFESGLAAAWLGAVPAIIWGGVGTFVLLGLWIPLFPSLWNRDHLITPDEEKS